MQNLKDLTVEQLNELQTQVVEEIKAREAAGNGYTKEFNISANKKAYMPATRKQYEFAESLAKKTNSDIEPTYSQIAKRMEMEDMSEAIDLMKEGKRIRIY